ncbi:MAG: hypothetical protein U0935_23195 [Pirellulales bacterium]
MLGEPPSTPYDLRFPVGSVPVRVHPFFWLLTLLIAPRHEDAMALLVWIGVVFVSILVHELGHAIAMIRYGQRPRIVLYGMGGLAISDGGGWARSKLVGARPAPAWVERVVISAAGPGAGFLLAALVVALVYAAGGIIHWLPPTLSHSFALFADLDNPRLAMLADSLLYVNTFWGVLNLMPIYPLDGGHIAASVLTARDPWRGIEQARWLAILVAGGLSALAFLGWNQVYLGVFFAYLAVSNYLAMQQRPW